MDREARRRRRDQRAEKRHKKPVDLQEPSRFGRQAKRIIAHTQDEHVYEDGRDAG